ncbi:glycine zipper 2TM domain-containing protein [Thalassotalea mangrovi]|uniref:Glycine zipper 2TM domain-containing protein n=2 Tax=Thalassotalea mangrovi TaxID=2572245 RepID=A0A4U1B5V8_9GAMM|nr:glycine zipper 2TM domain-containing protein [Thalassotalea mangrovi]
MKASALSLALATTILAGCVTTVDPYSGEEKVSNTTVGTTVGAVAGSLIGVAIGDNKESAAIGGVVGSAIGAGIGYNMDQQEAILRQKLQNSGVKVVRQHDGSIKLIMPSNITFANNESQVNPGFVNTLDAIAEVLKQNDNTRIQVVGHTDSVGNADYNQGLSVRRAAAVATEMRVLGVAANRIVSLGMGENQPLADNKYANGRALNRRVELFIVPAA